MPANDGTTALPPDGGPATGPADGGRAPIAVVTGAGRGIGRAVAGRLAARGVGVVLAVRDLARGRGVAAGLAEAGGDVHVVRLDVTDLTTIRAAAEFVDQRFGRLDILVNNAGVSGALPARPPGSADLQDVQDVFDTNVFGVLRVTNAFLPLLRRSGAGRIVNVTSGVGSLTRMSDPGDYLAALPPSVAYPVSKTALTALTVQYAKELRGTGILVNAADPGPCDTDLTRPLGLRLTRTADDGARVVVRLATLEPGGPSGGVFDGAGPVPW